MLLKEKTVTGLTWSFVDNFADRMIQFIIGIVLARILSPREFGLVGMLSIFIAISQVFIVSGFNRALIRKQNVTQEDYSTVFYFNLFIGVICYFILFFSAGVISNFFYEPELKPIVQVLGITLIIYALSFIQRTILTKRIDFKLQARITIFSSIGSGLISIVMAYSGYGVWSLVARAISFAALTSILFWLWNNWKPSWIFNIKSFKELFSFGSKILISSIIDSIFRNVYLIVIGKYFSATELGYYTKADQFQALPSQNLMGVIERVSYPVLSSISEDKNKLKSAVKRLIQSTMLLNFSLMLGMAVIAKPMVITLIGEKWMPSVIYLQLLCFAGIFYPLHVLNLNVLMVKGRSDLFLRVEIIKKTIAVPTIIIGVIWGIKIMIISYIIINIISYYINSYYTGMLIDYSFFEQIKDIFPSFLLASCVSIILLVGGYFYGYIPSLLLMIFQIAAGALLTIGICEWLKLNNYLYLKKIAMEKLKCIKISWNKISNNT
jgi:O-antigen/teichoic acid export membrane protein